MSDLEYIKIIAEGLYPDKWEEFKTYDGTNEKYIVVGNDSFDPFDKWSDCGEVLEDLIENKEKVVFLKSIYGVNLKYGPLYIPEGDNTKHDICMAWINYNS